MYVEILGTIKSLGLCMLNLKHVSLANAPRLQQVAVISILNGVYLCPCLL